jgi:hypothetical protein
MKKIHLLSIFIIIGSQYTLCMEESQEIILLGTSDYYSRTISRDYISKKKLPKDDNIIRFPNAYATDIVCIWNALKSIHTPDKSSFLHDLTMYGLVNVTNNLNNVLSTNKLKKCVIPSLIQKIKTTSYENPLDLKYVSELNSVIKNIVSKTLLQEPIIVPLLKPYSQKLNQSDFLASHFTLPFPLPQTIEQHAYVGNKITVSFLGTLKSDEYQLVIRTENDLKNFTLPESVNVTYDPDHFLVSDDETIVVCECDNNRYVQNHKCLQIIDRTSNTTKQIKLLSDDYAACCFGNNNEIYGVNKEGIWLLNSKTEEFTQVYRNQDDNNAQRIIKRKDHFFVYTREGYKTKGQFLLGTKNEKSEFEFKNILDFNALNVGNIIINSTGKKLCIVCVSRGKRSSDETRVNFYLKNLDSPNTFLHLNTVTDTTFPRNSMASFSADGNLLIIGYYEKTDKKTKYLFFDTQSSTYWHKESDGELVTLGTSKSIEEKSGLCTHQAHCLTLIDSTMAKSLELLTVDDSVNQNPHPLDIIIPLYSIIQKDTVGTRSLFDGLPAEITTMLESHKAHVQEEKKRTFFSSFSWNNIKALLGYRKLFLSVAAIACLVGSISIMK